MSRTKNYVSEYHGIDITYKVNENKFTVNDHAGLVGEYDTASEAEKAIRDYLFPERALGIAKKPVTKVLVLRWSEPEDDQDYELATTRFAEASYGKLWVTLKGGRRLAVHAESVYADTKANRAIFAKLKAMARAEEKRQRLHDKAMKAKGKTLKLAKA